MKVQFTKQSTSQIISALQQAMAGRSLGDLVSLTDQGGALEVKISKLGTSVLTFSREESGDSVIFGLTNEKIAFAHKAFKDDVKQKLKNIIEKIGGKVLEA